MSLADKAKSLATRHAPVVGAVGLGGAMAGMNYGLTSPKMLAHNQEFTNHVDSLALKKGVKHRSAEYHKLFNEEANKARKFHTAFGGIVGGLSGGFAGHAIKHGSDQSAFWTAFDRT